MIDDDSVAVLATSRDTSTKTIETKAALSASRGGIFYLGGKYLLFPGVEGEDEQRDELSVQSRDRLAAQLAPSTP